MIRQRLALAVMALAILANALAPIPAETKHQIIISSAVMMAVLHALP